MSLFLRSIIFPFDEHWHSDEHVYWDSPHDVKTEQMADLPSTNGDLDELNELSTVEQDTIITDLSLDLDNNNLEVLNTLWNSNEQYLDIETTLENSINWDNLNEKTSSWEDLENSDSISIEDGDSLKETDLGDVDLGDIDSGDINTGDIDSENPDKKTETSTWVINSITDDSWEEDNDLWEIITWEVSTWEVSTWEDSTWKINSWEITGEESLDTSSEEDGLDTSSEENDSDTSSEENLDIIDTQSDSSQTWTWEEVSKNESNDDLVSEEIITQTGESLTQVDEINVNLWNSLWSDLNKKENSEQTHERLKLFYDSLKEKWRAQNTEPEYETSSWSEKMTSTTKITKIKDIEFNNENELVIKGKKIKLKNKLSLKKDENWKLKINITPNQTDDSKTKNTSGFNSKSLSSIDIEVADISDTVSDDKNTKISQVFSDMQIDEMMEAIASVSRADITLDEETWEIEEPNYVFYTLWRSDWWYWENEPLSIHQNVWKSSNEYQVTWSWITVSVIDTWVNTDHKDFDNTKRVNKWEIKNNDIDDDDNGYIDDIYGWNFIDWNNDTSDTLNHGTHIAWLIGAGYNSDTIIWAAPESKIISLKICNNSGFCPADKMIEALDYAVDNWSDIIVIALWSPYYSHILKLAIDRALEAGVIIVASAWNAWSNELYYPAAYDGVVSVWATEKDGIRASFSNYGSWLDLVSPWVEILSSSNSDGHSIMNWTSPSAGIVAGIFALIKEYYPEKSAASLIEAAKLTAEDMWTSWYDIETGYWMIDLISLFDLSEWEISWSWFVASGTGTFTGEIIENILFTTQAVNNIIPNVKHANDDTGDNLSSIISDNAVENPDTLSAMSTLDNVYTVDKGSVMQIDGFDVSSIPAWVAVTAAVMHLQYGAENGYGGGNSVRYDNWWGLTNTTITPSDIAWWSADLTYDLFAQWVDTIAELQSLDIEFTSNDNAGADAIHFDYIWIEVTYSEIGNIDSTSSTDAVSFNGTSPSTVFISDQIWYTFYVDSDGSCVYKKTPDGWGSWNAAVTVDSQTDCNHIAVWYDGWTPWNSTWTYIHISTVDSWDDDIWYTALDTSDDSLSTTINISWGQWGSFATNSNLLALTMGTNGNLYIWIRDNHDNFVVKCDGTSDCSQAINWSEAGTNPFTIEQGWQILIPLANDNILMVEANMTSGYDIVSKVYTESTNSWDWAGVTIDASARANMIYFWQMGATLNKSTNDVYLIYAADTNSFWTNDDIRTAVYSWGSWTNKTDVLTNEARWITDNRIALDENTGDIYAIYTARTTAWTPSTANVYWKKSTDGMATWWAEQGPINAAAWDLIGLNVNIYSDERIYVTWDEVSSNDLFGSTLADLVPPIITVSTTWSQTINLDISTSNNYIWWAFTFQRDNGTWNVTQIILSELGNIDANSNLSNLDIYYETAATCTYDWDETLFGSSLSFDGSENATVTGSMNIWTSQVCVYSLLDVWAWASSGNTIEIEITDPSTEITVDSGNVSPASQIAISGSTTVLWAIDTNLTLSSTGTQIATLAWSSTWNYIWWAFVASVDNWTWAISSITISESWSIVANSELSNLKIYYKEESVCSSTMPWGVSLFNSVWWSFNASEISTVTWSMVIWTGNVCMYVQLDIWSWIAAEDVIEIRINDSSSDVISDADSISPSTALELSGSTVIVVPSIWPFRASSNYSYDSSKIGINGSGIAVLLKAKNTDNTNDWTNWFWAWTHWNTQWDIWNTWLELDAAWDAAGFGNFSSRIMDAWASMSWNNLSWSWANANMNINTKSQISAAAPNWIYGVHAADIDSDGDMDALSASWVDDTIAWYENDWSQNFTQRIVTATADSAVNVHAVDLDEDGDMDILSLSSVDEVTAWYENDWSENFTQRIIDNSLFDPYDIFPIDIDGDNDLDLVVALLVSDKVVWYENDWNENFLSHIIDNASDWARFVHAIDLDGDTDIDILAASKNDNRITWYENDWSENFTEILIDWAWSEPTFVYAIDVDWDSDIDIVWATWWDDTIAWYDNDGSENFTKKVISVTVDNPRSTYPIDYDGDGDIDVTSVGFSENNYYLYENDWSENFTERIIGNWFFQWVASFPVDMDWDWDIDGLVWDYAGDKMIWFEQDTWYSLKFQVRSCDDNSCTGESFVGPDGTASTYYTNYTWETITNINNNQYFQYKVLLDEVSGNYVPTLDSVSINWTGSSFASDNPTIVNNVWQEFNSYISSFNETLWGSNAGLVEYQISHNGTWWYFWNWSNWVEQTWSWYPLQTNTISEVSSNSEQYDDDIGTGSFYFKAFMVSDWSQKVEIDELSLVSDTGATINITVSSTWVAVSTLVWINSTGNHIGWAFTFITDIGTWTVSNITITGTWTIDEASELSNLKVYYKQESVCSTWSIPWGVSVFNGTWGSFNGSWSSSVTWSMLVGTGQTCVYVTVDIGTWASNSDTIVFEISNASTDIVSDADWVGPSWVVSMIWDAKITITGTTNLILGSTWTQITSITWFTWNYIWWAFTIATDIWTWTISSIIVSESWSINANNELSNLQIYYKQEVTCSWSIPWDAILFNATWATFNALEKATVTWSMTVWTGNICIYLSVDIWTWASNLDTIKLEISDPTTDIISNADSIGPISAINIAWDSDILIYKNLTLSSTWISLTTLVSINSTGNHVGWAFTLISDNWTWVVSSITFTETWSIDSKTQLSNLMVYYKEEGVCSSGAIPWGVSLFNNGGAWSLFNSSGSSTVTWSMIIGTGQTCMYLSVDIGSWASNLDTIWFEVSSPSSDIIFDWDSVGPAWSIGLAWDSSILIISSPPSSWGSSGGWWGNNGWWGGSNQNIVQEDVNNDPSVIVKDISNEKDQDTMAIDQGTNNNDTNLIIENENAEKDPVIIVADVSNEKNQGIIIENEITNKDPETMATNEIINNDANPIIENVNTKQDPITTVENDISSNNSIKKEINDQWNPIITAEDVNPDSENDSLITKIIDNIFWDKNSLLWNIYNKTLWNKITENSQWWKNNWWNNNSTKNSVFNIFKFNTENETTPEDTQWWENDTLIDDSADWISIEIPKKNDSKKTTPKNNLRPKSRWSLASVVNNIFTDDDPEIEEIEFLDDDSLTEEEKAIAKIQFISLNVIIENSAMPYASLINPNSLMSCIDSGLKCWIFNETEYSIKTLTKNWWESPSLVEYVTTIKNPLNWKNNKKLKSKFKISPNVNFENLYTLKVVPHIWKLDTKVSAYIKLENWDRKFIGSKNRSIIIIPEYVTILIIISMMSLWYVYYRKRRDEDPDLT